MGKSGERWGKVVKSGEKWGKVVKSGHRWPFWMTENHLRSQFLPFQINTQLLFFLNVFSKWPSAAILDPDFFFKNRYGPTSIVGQ